MKGTMSGKGVTVLVAVFILFVIEGAAALAGEKTPHYRASGFGDLYTGGMVGFDMNFATGDDVTGYVPTFLLQYGIGDVAFGMQWGLAYADVDIPGSGDYDGELAVGNFILNFKAKHCMAGTWKTCMGANFSLGIGPFEVDSMEELLSFSVGIYTHTMRYVNFAPESMVIDPLFALNTTNDMVFVQIALGPSVLVPLDDTDVRDVEACLAYSFEAGILAIDMLSLGLGFKGVSTLTADDNESLFSIDINIRLVLEGVSPGVRLSIPFSTEDDLSDVFDLIVALGLTADF